MLAEATVADQRACRVVLIPFGVSDEREDAIFAGFLYNAHLRRYKQRNPPRAKSDGSGELTPTLRRGTNCSRYCSFHVLDMDGAALLVWTDPIPRVPGEWILGSDLLILWGSFVVRTG